MLSPLLLALVLSVAVEERPSEASASPSGPAASEAVAAVIQRLIAADNARNLETVMASYSKDVVFLPPTGEVVSGLPAIRARYQRLFSEFRPHLACTLSEVAVSGHLAFVRGTNNGYPEPVAAGTPTAVNDNFLAVLSFQGPAWRISRLIWVKRTSMQ